MSARKVDTHNVVDVDWVKQSFMMDSSNIDGEDALYRVFTTAAYKFADTTPGGNAAINPPPQFTRYADMKTGGNSGGAPLQDYSRGMGRYYSEAIDDNAVHAIMRFGVPAYNSLTSFFTNFYNAEASAMARTGRGTSLFFKAGQVVGLIVGIVPRSLLFMGDVIKWFAGRPASKYYYMKPAMPLYWNSVATMLNTIAVNMGVLPPLVGTPQNFVNDPSQENDTSPIAASTLNAYMRQQLPDIFTDSGNVGGIDVYSIATKYQRLYHAFREAGYDALLASGASKMLASGASKNGIVDPTAIENLRTTLANFVSNPVTPVTKFGGLTSYVSAYIGIANQTAYSPGSDQYHQTDVNNSPVSGSGSSAGGSSPSPGGTTTGGSGSTAAGASTAAANQPATSVAMNTGALGATESIYKPGGNAPFEESYWKAFGDFLWAELQDGGAFVSFRVDGSGTIGESFSTQVKEAEIQSKINSMSASAASTRFDLADGNLGGGLIGKTIEGVLGAVKDVVAGVASGIGVRGIAAALAGNAFVEIPKVWDSSSANLPTADFTIQLRSPYGNKMSRLLNLYLPLCMILAGALPISTGKQSYTAPFLCEVYVRGRMTCRLGMINSLSITRGTGNIGWTDEGEPLGIDINFSVVDLSNVMFMPIAANFTAFQAVTEAVGDALGGNTGKAVAGSLATSTWDDDNAFTDYMAVLGSLTMVDQVSRYRQWKLRLTQQAAKFNAWKSAGHFASWMGGTWPFRVISGFVPAARQGQTGG